MKDLIDGYDFKNGFKMASLFGMDTDDPVEAIEFLRGIPAKDLVAKQNQLLKQEVNELIHLTMRNDTYVSPILLKLFKVVLEYPNKLYSIHRFSVLEIYI